MSTMAQYAEEAQHHPEWFNVYNRLNINLRTHDCDGISEKDFLLAEIFDLQWKNWKKVSDFEFQKI